jgi:hypothetical protein
MPLASPANQILGACLAAVAATLPCAVSEAALRTYAIVGDAIPQSLTGEPGDVTRGRALVVDRANTCILCHNGPFPEAKFQGDLAPGLGGAEADPVGRADRGYGGVSRKLTRLGKQNKRCANNEIPRDASSSASPAARRRWAPFRS